MVQWLIDTFTIDVRSKVKTETIMTMINDELGEDEVPNAVVLAASVKLAFPTADVATGKTKRFRNEKTGKNEPKKCVLGLSPKAKGLIRVVKSSNMRGDAVSNPCTAKADGGPPA